jgi:multicomponent Na+:H+ antiporter subunit E
MLSGFFNPLFIVFGILSVLTSLYFTRKMDLVGEYNILNKAPSYISFKFLTYAFWLVKEMVVSTIKLSLEIWREKPQITPALSWVGHNLQSEEKIALYANSITLTPGTISIAINGKEILVHAIQKETMEDLKSGKMESKITGTVK